MRDAKMTFLPKKSSASLAGSNFKPRKLTELIRRGLAGSRATAGPLRARRDPPKTDRGAPAGYRTPRRLSDADLRRAADVPPAALLLRPRLASPAAQLPVGHGIHRAGRDVDDGARTPAPGRVTAAEDTEALFIRPARSTPCTTARRRRAGRRR
jgi:hypothetical protein